MGGWTARHFWGGEKRKGKRKKRRGFCREGKEAGGALVGGVGKLGVKAACFVDFFCACMTIGKVGLHGQFRGVNLVGFAVCLLIELHGYSVEGEKSSIGYLGTVALPWELLGSMKWLMVYS